MRRAVSVVVAVSLLLTGCNAIKLLKYCVFPDYPSDEGEFRIPGLTASVDVIYDEWGIPHIIGKTEDDLLAALGWVHARDRLFQMELMRRVVTGRASEIFGDVPIGEGFYGATTTLEMDKVNRLLGFKLYAEEITEKLHPRAKEMLEAYCRGVNAYIESAERLPIEFRLLGYEPEPWKPQDSIAIALYAYWGNSTNAEHELIRYVLREGYGERAVEEVFPVNLGYERYIIPRDVKDFRRMFERTNRIPPASIPRGFLDRRPVARLAGILLGHRSTSPFMSYGQSSNGWVVSGARSKSGKPILANDPHLPHMMPSVMYIVHLKGDGYDTIGGSFPGTPAIFVGHNRYIAWGSTTTNADTQDIYIEKPDERNPGHYIFRGESLPVETIRDTIRYKDADGRTKEIEVTIKRTLHGLVLNPLLGKLGDRLPPVVVRWSAWDSTEDLIARAKAAKAKNMEEFKEALHHHGAPIINWIYADIHGHIGYFPVGLVPKRVGWDGTMPVPGWTGEFEWSGYIAFDEAPILEDPERGYIVTANNKVLPDGDLPFPFCNDALPPYRAMRIEELILQKPKLDADDMRRIQSDRKPVQAEMLVPVFLKAFERIENPTELELRARDMLKSWDFNTQPESVATTIYQMLLYKAFYMIYSDQLEPDVVELIRRAFKAYAKFDALLLREESMFFDDANTPEVEDKYDMLARVWRETIRELSQKLGANIEEWQWGKVHTLTFRHPFGSVGALARIFNYGPFADGGARGTVWLALFFWEKDDPFRTTAGPVLRHIVDMADVDGSTIVVDTGQSGWPLSPHYHDMADLWLKVEAVPALLDIDRIKEHSSGTVKLVP